MAVIAAGSLLLAVEREVGYALEITDDAGQVVQVLAVALGALVQVTLVDVSAVVAKGVGNVERKVVASLAGSHTQQLAVLLEAQVLVQIHVERRAAGQVLDVLAAVQAELVEHVGVRVFHHVEITVVTVARHVVAVLAVPAGVFHTHVLGRNHLAVEHHLFGAVFLVVVLNKTQYVLNKTQILLVVRNAHAQALGSLDHTVDTDGQVLAGDIDVAGIEEGQHTFLEQVFQVLVVGQLYLVDEVDYLFQEIKIGTTLTRSLLHAAVEVDGEHTLGARGNTSGPERIAEAVVLDFVAQAAAGSQGVGVVAHVGKEGMALGIHFSREVGIFLVDNVAVLGEQGHRLDGEGEHRLGTFLVEPAHEALLQPVDGRPAGFGAVREEEIAEYALEIVFVVVGNVPEYGLEVAGSRGLVDRVDNLLEAVGDNLVNGALLERKVHALVGTLVEVGTVLLAEEVRQVHQEFRRGAGSREHTRNDKHHVDKAAAERLQIGRRR